MLTKEQTEDRLMVFLQPCFSLPKPVILRDSDYGQNEAEKDKRTLAHKWRT